MDMFAFDKMDRMIDVGDIVVYSGPCHQLYYGRVMKINQYTGGLNLQRTNGSKPNVRPRNTLILAKFTQLDWMPRTVLDMFENPVKEEF